MNIPVVLRCSTAGATLILSLVGGVAVASGEAEEPVFFETATVTARALDRATAAVTVLEREQIEELDVVSVAELIRHIPGMDVTPSGGRSGVTTAQIRGGDPNYTVILIDGVPLNDNTDQFGGTVNLSSLSTSLVDRIEVVRGPLSSSYGSTGLAGVVNIITRRGADDESPPFGFDVSAGSDSIASSSAYFAGGNEKRDYFVGLSWDEEEDRVVEDEFTQLALQANAGFATGADGRLRLTGRIADWDARDYPEASGGPEALCPPATASCITRESEHDEISLGLEWTGGRRHRQKVFANGYRHELQRTSPAIPPFLPESVEDTRYTHWRAGWAMPGIRLSDSVRLSVGAEVDVEDGKSDSDFGFPAGYRIDRMTPGAFAELIAERGRTLYEVGVRVDDPEDLGVEVSPRFGVTYDVADGKTRLRASIGRAFKLPSFFATATPIVGNPDLVPEIALGVDAGFEHRFEPGDVTFALTLFYNRFSDLITFVGSSFTHENLPEVESKGLEAWVDWQPLEAISIRANMTRQDFTNKGPEELTNRPGWFGALGFVWRITERARWEVDGQWVSESFDFQAPVDPVDPQRTAGYQLYGTSGSYRFGKRWEVHARVDNLSDKEYEPHIGFPAPGRSFRLGLRLR